MAGYRLLPSDESPTWGRKWGVGLLAVLLVWECLLPLSQTERTDRVDVFLLAFLLLLAIQFGVRFAWLRLPLSGLVMGTMLYRAHFVRDYSFLDSGWLADWVDQFAQGWAVWWDGQGLVGPAPFHTFWFLLSLWGLAILFRIWALERERIFPFFIGAVIALSIMDSFTPYDASGAILRVFVYGFVALAWLRLSQLKAQSAGDAPPAKGWTLLVTGLIVAAISTGWVAPKPEASWPNPVGWIPSGDDRAGGVGLRQIGYGRDDSRLGGSLRMNEDVVIEALVETPYYWRGESRDLYTGKGWQNTLRPDQRYPFNGQSLEVEAELFRGLPTDDNQVFSSYLRRYPILFTPGELQRIANLNPAENVILQQPGHGGFVTADNTPLEETALATEIPRIDEEDLRESGQEYPREITDIYLQLPDSLPDRVRDLARQVAEDADNPYDVAKAVENHLRQEGGYTYELDDVPFPGEGEDFVDHFLFTSQQGYCDHFSTAMVVMLRSLDIPARWVKGFTPGDSERVTDEEVLERYNAETLYRNEVKNSNAHSWVEVYFEGRGWIPLEPTPGFANPTPIDVNLDSSTEETDSETNDEEESTAGPDPIQQQLEAEQSLAGGETTQRASTSWQNWLWGTGLTGLALVMVGWFLRDRLVWWWLRRLPSGERPFLRAYGSLLQWLSWVQGPRRPHQTLREYVLDRDWMHQPSEELRELTRAYEESRYGKGKSNWGERTLHLWKRVMEQFRP